MPGVRLFEWLHGAPFYHGILVAAVHSLPEGTDKTWLDVGCGPGMLAILAAEHGYRAVGVDPNPMMIESAKRLGREMRSDAQFRVATLEQLGDADADVVSAASLLPVIRDTRTAIRLLWDAVRPGGSLILVETTKRMRIGHALRALYTSRIPHKRAFGLVLWALVRNGKVVDLSELASLPAVSVSVIEVLEGMVEIRCLQKAGAS